MSVSRAINTVWTSLTPEDKARIKQVTGVDPEECTTRAERYAVLAQFSAQTTSSPLQLLPSAAPQAVSISPSIRALSSSRSGHPQTIETVVGREIFQSPRVYQGVARENYSERGRPRSHLATISTTFLQKAAEYTLILALTVGGAYAGFSASRYTPLAEELRVLERDPVIYAYKVKEDLDSYHALKKFDVFSPDRDQADRDKEFINTVQEGVEGAVNGVVNAAKGAIGGIPFFGQLGVQLIEQKQQEKQQEISAYLGKLGQHSSEMGMYTIAGAGSGFTLGIAFSFLWRRRTR